MNSFHSYKVGDIAELYVGKNKVAEKVITEEDLKEEFAVAKQDIIAAKVNVKEVMNAMPFEQIAGHCKCCKQYSYCVQPFNRDCGVLQSIVMNAAEEMGYDASWEDDEDMVPEDDDTVVTDDQKDIARSLLQISEYFEGLLEEFKTLAHLLYDGVEDE